MLNKKTSERQKNIERQDKVKAESERREASCGGVGSASGGMKERKNVNQLV